MLDDSRFPGRLHFIAHAVRDIADRLVFVLDPQLDGERVQYENKLDDFEKLWPVIESIEEGDDAVAKGEVHIAYELAIKIDSLIRDHRERRRRRSHFELLFRHLMQNEPAHAEANQRLAADFKAMRDWFMGFAHLRSDGPPVVAEDELQRQFNKFETMLHSFVGDFFTGTAELDEILQQANQSAN